MKVPGAEYSAERVQSEIPTLLTHRAPLPPTPKPPAVNWDMWLKMPRVALWEAVALSLNVEPIQNTATWKTFDSRMSLALAHLAEGRLLHVDANDVKRVAFTRVRLADMAYLAEYCGWTLPAEFPRAEAPPPLAPTVVKADATATLDPGPATQAPTSVSASQVPETAEHRQDRRLKACIEAGLPINTKAALSRLPDGVGRVAKAEGVTRQTFSIDVKTALTRREGVKREGIQVHRD